MRTAALGLVRHRGQVVIELSGYITSDVLNEVRTYAGDQSVKLDLHQAGLAPVAARVLEEWRQSEPDRLMVLGGGHRHTPLLVRLNG